MFVQSAWRPNLGYTPINVTPAITSSTAVALSRSSPTNTYNAFRIVNNGNDTVYLAFGDSAVANADAADLALLPNSVEVIDIPPEVTHFKHIAVGAGTNLLQLWEGNGI